MDLNSFHTTFATNLVSNYSDIEQRSGDLGMACNYLAMASQKVWEFRSFWMGFLKGLVNKTKTSAYNIGIILDDYFYYVT